MGQFDFSDRRRLPGLLDALSAKIQSSAVPGEAKPNTVTGIAIPLDLADQIPIPDPLALDLVLNAIGPQIGFPSINDPMMSDTSRAYP
ncbi:MAG: hypothetical protein K2Y27_09195 [Xanthobacteraceae bacterium]|nr:hypothetical protein [Xanthobacteraceae bacterium]